MKRKYLFSTNLFVILSCFIPMFLTNSSNYIYQEYNHHKLINLLSNEENVSLNTYVSAYNFNKTDEPSFNKTSDFLEGSFRPTSILETDLKLAVFLEEDNNIVDIILKNKLNDNRIEEIVNNTFFLNYTNLTLINYHCRHILNISENLSINYTLVDNLLNKFLKHKKGSEVRKELRNKEVIGNDTVENSYIFLINIKILYYNYLLYSREFTDNRIYYWDIRLEDMMADLEFLNSTSFNRSEAIIVINAFCSKNNLAKNDYNMIDFTIRSLVQSDYEDQMYNRSGLSSEDKDLIRKIIEMKRRYKNYVQERKLRELEYLENHIGMEMIVNDTQYVKLINLTEWQRIEKIGRKFTDNYNLSEKVNWKQFDRVFSKLKSNYTEEETIVNDDIYTSFKEIALFERDYYIWKKDKIENPIPPKKVKSQITNPASDSLFTDIGKNIHDSLQPLALAKISEKSIK